MDDLTAITWSLQLLETEPGTDHTSFQEQRLLLIKAVDTLIHHDFNKLLHILYRIDVDENKLKHALFESVLPAAETIADLIIERQQQKIRFREIYRNNKDLK